MLHHAAIRGHLQKEENYQRRRNTAQQKKTAVSFFNTINLYLFLNQANASMKLIFNLC